MKSSEEIKSIARRTIRKEAEAVLNLEGFIDDDFATCVGLIYNSGGRVVVTGIGKSANIGSKIVATLNSTGTPSVFMHAADAIHGDLGTIQPDDVIICISKSGNSPEIKMLVPLLRMLGNKLVALVGDTQSYLAQQADIVLNSMVKEEACPNNLAPTSSSTAQMVMGDALAVCLLECRGFTEKDFARFHPGGSLGKRLYLRVSDVYLKNEKPCVMANDDLKTVILEISSKRLGATAVLDGSQLTGIITDGDLRRMLQKNTSFENIVAVDIMSRNPKTIDSDALVVDALNLMREKNITQLLVVDQGNYAGVLHLHDILDEGII